MIDSIGGSGGKGGSGQSPVDMDDTLNSKQTVKLLLAVSEGEIDGITDVLLNQVSYKNYDAHYEVRTGTADQPALDGFIDIISPISPFNPAAIESGVSLFAAVPASAFSARLTLTLATLMHVTDKGDRLEYSASFSIYTRPNAGASWGLARSVTKTGKATNSYAWDLEVKRPDGVIAGSWEIKVERDTANDVVANEENPGHTYFSQTTWTAAQALYGNALPYPNTALVGLTVRDAEQFGGRVPEITIVAKGMKVRVPNNYDAVTHLYTGLWDGGLTELLYHSTPNPAWHLYNILRNPIYGLGIDAADIDLSSFYNFSVYADELVADGFGGTHYRYELHNQFIAREDIHTFLSKILSICHGTFGVNEFGQLSLVYDADGGAIKHQATNSSVIEGKFAYSSTTLEDRHTLVNVTFNDRFLFGRTNTATVSDDVLIARYGLQVMDVVLIGCYTEAQALRKARSVLWNSSISTKVVSFKNLFAGISYQPGELINIYDNDNQNDTQAGIVVSGTEGVLELDRTIVLGVEVYTVSYLSAIDGSVVEETVLGLTGTTLTITGTTLPADNSTFLLSGDVKAQTYKIITVSVDESEHTVTAVEHSELKYAYIDDVEGNGLLVRPTQDFLPKAEFNSPPVRSLSVSEYSTNTGINPRTLLEVSWVAPDTDYAPTYKVFWSTESGESFSATTSGVPYYEIGVTEPGIYTVAVASVNPFSGALSSKVSVVYFYKVGAGTSWLGAPTDIFIEGTVGTDFTGTDIAVTFQPPVENVTSTDSVKDYVIVVLSADGLTELAAYTIAPEADLSGRGVFTLDMNRGNFGTPTRTVNFLFYSRDQAGFLSTPAAVTFTNAAPAAVVGAITGQDYDLLLIVDPLSDLTDTSEIIVAAGASGFSPTEDTWLSTNLIGAALDGIKISVPALATYYARFALADTFGPYELNWSTQATVVVDGGGIQVAIGDASTSFLYVNSFTADGVITIGEKAVLRAGWLAQHKELVNKLEEAVEFSVDTAQYLADFVAMSTYLNDGVTWVYNAVPALPFHLNDIQQFVEIDLAGSTLPAFRTLTEAMLASQYVVDSAITVARNNLLAANTYVDPLIDDGIISQYEATQMRLDWLAIADQVQGLIEDGIPYNTTVEEVAYLAAFEALSTYLNAGISWTLAADYPTVPTYIQDNPAFVDIQLGVGEKLTEFRILIAGVLDTQLPFKGAISAGVAADNTKLATVEENATEGAPAGTSVNGVAVEDMTAGQAYVASMTDGGVISVEEKKAIRTDYLDQVGQWHLRRARALSGEFPITGRAYQTAITALQTYLNLGTSMGSIFDMPYSLNALQIELPTTLPGGEELPVFRQRIDDLLEAAKAFEAEASPQEETRVAKLATVADNATVGATWGSDLSGQPSDTQLLNINTTPADIGYIGDLNADVTNYSHVSIRNTAITVGANGVLTGAGGGQVTLTGIGFSGATNATYGATSAQVTSISNAATTGTWAGLTGIVQAANIAAVQGMFASISALNANLGNVNAGSITGAANINIEGSAVFNGYYTDNGYRTAVLANIDSTQAVGVKGYGSAFGVWGIGTQQGIRGQGRGANSWGVLATGYAYGVNAKAYKLSGVGLYGTNFFGGTAVHCDGVMKKTGTEVVVNLNADMVDSRHAGNASNNVALSNGTQCTNLNANYLQGNLASAFATAAHHHAGTYLPRNSTAYNSSRLGHRLLSQMCYRAGTTSGNANASSGYINIVTAGSLAGAYRTTGSGNTVYITDNASDRRVKRDILPEALGLQFLNAVKPVTFNFKTEETGAPTHHGLIAQDVEEASGLVPNADDLFSEDEDGTKKVGYAALTPILIKAVQELSTQVTELKQELKELKNAKN